MKQQAYGSTPLEKLEKSAFDREQYRNLTMLRAVQGIQAPLRLLAERKAASNIGHMPFLPRSNLMLDVLEGRDELITPNEIFNSKQKQNMKMLFSQLISSFYFRSSRVWRSSAASSHDHGTSGWYSVNWLITRSLPTFLFLQWKETHACNLHKWYTLFLINRI